MERERWGRITDLFDAALEHPPSTRDSYLEDACRGDPDLLRDLRGLLTAFEKAGDFLERPLFLTVQAIASGAIIGHRYRIERLIGRGGMGEVYLAHDQLIDEQIALKTLRRDLGDNAEFLRRFHREARLARQVTHRSVCRVFEVGVHDDAGARPVHFFSMQLLAGETLAARIRRDGPLPKVEALALAREMADGLDAAHAAGITHRDFKSANVMLYDGHAVIMDFGLARATFVEGGREQRAGSVTVGAQVAGTVAYMSPEQLSGGTVTKTTDIYSFGVVLFEMVTGRLPFNDEHIIRSAMQRAAEDAPDVRAMAPQLDARWAAVITRCLRLNPDKRFQHAGDVVEALLSTSWRPAMPHWTRRQWAIAAFGLAGSAGGMALVTTAVRFYSRDVRVAEGAKVLLGSIDNSTGDPRFDGIRELFRNQLSQSVHFALIDDDKLAEELKEMRAPQGTTEVALVRQAGRRLAVRLSVFGNLSRIGPDYALNVQLETPGSHPNAPRSKSLRSFSASDATLMRAVRDASVWIREAVGESASTVASFDRLPEYATTPSWEALTVYARGQELFMRQDYESAILEFEAALRIDPQFTLAAFRRGDLLMSQGRHTEGLRQWREAIRMLDVRPVTRAEELNARGMFAHDTGDFEGADRLFRTWALEYPHDWHPPYFRVVSLMLNGRAQEALDLLEPLRAAAPNFGDIYGEMIACHLLLGNTGEARALIPEVRRLNSAARADFREGYVRFREGNCAGYFEILQQIRQSTANPLAAADAMVREALLLFDCGLPGPAALRIAAFLDAGSRVEASSAEPSLQILQAWGEMLSGNVDAVRHAQETLKREKGPVLAALAGTIFVRNGRVDLANELLELCEGFDDVRIYRIAKHRILGEQARVEGRLALALEELRKAAALEPHIAHRQYLLEALPPDDSERLELALNVVRIPWQLLRPPPLHCLGSLAVAVPIVLGAAGVNEPFARRFEASRAKIADMVAHA